MLRRDAKRPYPHYRPPQQASVGFHRFTLPGSIPGAVGVLGPLRMDYAFTLAVVDTVGSRVADLLSA